MIRNSRIAVPLVAVLLAAAGCSEGSSAPGDGAGAASAGGSVTTTAADGTMRVDMDAIFPVGAGRDLLLNNCQSCHTWAPVVVLQMTPEEWDRWAVEHRQRVSNLSEEEFATLKTYLAENFNPSRPVPELPPALLEGWTTY